MWRIITAIRRLQIYYYGYADTDASRSYGLIMLLLGAIILTEVLKKLASKNKDINILRTLGYDTNN